MTRGTTIGKLAISEKLQFEIHVRAPCMEAHAAPKKLKYNAVVSGATVCMNKLVQNKDNATGEVPATASFVLRRSTPQGFLNLQNLWCIIPRSRISVQSRKHPQ